MMIAAAISLLRRGSSSVHYFPAGHHATVRGARLLRALHSGRTNSTTRSLWLPQTASTSVYNKHFSTLKPDVVSPSTNILSGEENPKDDVKGKDVLFVYAGMHSALFANIKRRLMFRICFHSVLIAGIIASFPYLYIEHGYCGLALCCCLLNSMGSYAYEHAGRWWFCRSYIDRLIWVPGSDSFQVDMGSWFGRYITKTIKLADVKPLRHKDPLITFEANGRPYFVENRHFQNKELLAMLTPPSITRQD